MIFTKQLPQLAKDFAREFGEHWTKIYKEDLKEYAPYNLHLVDLECLL